MAFSGVNMALGPVADVLTDYDNYVISQRSYSSDPYIASEFVSNAVYGYLTADLIPVVKHFPGHGGIPGDSHDLLPIDKADRQQLGSEYLPPFLSAIEAGAPVIMTSHVAFPNISGNNLPASISPEIMRIIREEMNFNGIIMTDAMDMGAITAVSSSMDVYIQAVQSGVDIQLIVNPNAAQTAVNNVITAVQSGLISETAINEAVHRILTVKSDFGLESFWAKENPNFDWDSHSNLAHEIGYQAVSLIRNQDGLIPIPSQYHNIYVISPPDAWSLDYYLSNRLQQYGFAADFFHYSGPWNGLIPETDYIRSIPAQANNYDLTIMFTWESHLNYFRFGDTWQRQVIKGLLDQDNPLIVVALKSPTDLIDFPDVGTYLATFGTTTGQMQAIADILVGESSPPGGVPWLQIP